MNQRCHLYCTHLVNMVTSYGLNDRDSIPTNCTEQSPSRNVSHSTSKKKKPFMQPEGSLPFSQEPATGPYSKPDESNLQLPPLFLKTHSSIILPSSSRSSEWPFLQVIRLKFYIISHLSHACYMYRSSHPGWAFRNCTYLQELVPRSRMRGAIPPLLQYVFMAWCLVSTGTTLPLPYMHSRTIRNLYKCSKTSHLDAQLRNG
jgi:hypothetical protein